MAAKDSTGHLFAEGSRSGARLRERIDLDVGATPCYDRPDRPGRPDDCSDGFDRPDDRPNGPDDRPDGPARADSSNGSTIHAVWDHLGHNGYQTGTALIVATIAIVALINIKASLYVLLPVAIGAFWAGWLGWNTVTGNSNPLFTGDPPALGLWDIAFQSDMSFLAVVIVACVAAVLLWRKSAGGVGKIAIIIGVALGASFVYNIVQSVRAS